MRFLWILIVYAAAQNVSIIVPKTIAPLEVSPNREWTILANETIIVLPGQCASIPSGLWIGPRHLMSLHSRSDTLVVESSQQKRELVIALCSTSNQCIQKQRGDALIQLLYRGPEPPFVSSTFPVVVLAPSKYQLVAQGSLTVTSANTTYASNIQTTLQPTQFQFVYDSSHSLCHMDSLSVVNGSLVLVVSPVYSAGCIILAGSPLGVATVE